MGASRPSLYPLAGHPYPPGCPDSPTAVAARHPLNHAVAPPARRQTLRLAKDHAATALREAPSCPLPRGDRPRAELCGRALTLRLDVPPPGHRGRPPAGRWGPLAHPLARAPVPHGRAAAALFGDPLLLQRPPPN